MREKRRSCLTNALKVPKSVLKVPKSVSKVPKSVLNVPKSVAVRPRINRTANERRRRGTMYVDAGIVNRAGVAVEGASATMRTQLRGDRAGRGDGVRRPMTTRTTRMTVARRKGEEKTRGKKGDKRDKRGSNKKNGAKKLKPPMDGGRTLKIGPTYVEVPEAIPRMLEQTPRPALYAGGAIVVLLLQKLLFGKRSGSRGSLGDLEERGMLDENREVDEEKFFKGMMKSVRTIEMPELTEEQILAARERRRQSAGGNENFEKSLAEAEIPANHPWATKEKLTPKQEREAEQRVLEANRPRRRRRAPPQ